MCYIYAYMKLINLFIFALILIVLLSFTTMGSCTYVPYVKDMLFTNMYPYEGFKSNPAEYSTYTKKSEPEVDSTSPSVSPQCQKVTGFDGLYCPAKIEGDPDNPMDIFSKASGDWKCESHGLMNSKGFLCLDSNMKKLLTTRGGNA